MAYNIDTTYQLGTNEGSSQRAQNLYLILHETANAKATGANEAAYMKRNWNNAYVHFIVGDGKVYQMGETGYVAYGAGNANGYSPVQIELQHTLDPALFAKNYAIYIELARDMAKKYGIPLTLDAGGAGTAGIKSHNWISQNVWGNHTDPYGYLAQMGVSKDKLASDLASGSTGTGGGTIVTPPTKPTAPSKPAPSVNVTYSLRNLNGGWNGDITNFNNSDSNGFAGVPNGQHDLLTISVNHGSVKYRAHTVGYGWNGWITGSNKNDTVNGCAGISGRAIDGVQMEYITPSGEPYQQAWYRSQTTARGYWLGVVCDQGQSIKDYKDSFAGMLGEPMDRLQIGIAPSNPF